MLKPKQAGLSLLEIMLVMIIAVVLIGISLQQYGVYRYYQQVAVVKQQVQELLSAVSKYYFSVCLSQVENTNQYSAAKQALNSAITGLSVDSIKSYLTVSTAGMVNPLGSFSDGDFFKVALVNLPFVRNNIQFTQATLNDRTYGNTDYQTRGFDSDYLWQAKVAMCFTTADTSASAAQMAQNLFGADTATVTAQGDNCAGILLTWTRLPRNEALHDSSLASLHPTNAQYLKLYQWGNWMKATFKDDRLNYVCQS